MLPGDYLARYGDHFDDRGFKRLTGRGASFTNAHFEYAVTFTGPGHATIVTGAAPATHGIIGNQWHRAGTDASINCVDDPESMTIGPVEVFDSRGYSPHFMEAPTIGDALRGRYGDEAKIWSVSLKERAAILGGGKAANGAIWFMPQSGDFATSTFYYRVAPEWCTKLNADRYPDRFFGTQWDRFLPDDAYARCDIDDAAYEQGPRLIWLNDLPKTLGPASPEPNRMYYEQLQCSPFGNELVFEAARQAVENEALGRDVVPDLLVMSLSSTDYCGHVFGLDSHEMLDMMARTDSQIGDWLAYLDQQVGEGQYLVVLTSDHGAASAPEVTEAAGLGGGRIDLRQMFADLNAKMVEYFGPTEQGFYYLTAIDFPWVALNTQVLRYQKIDLVEAADVVAEAAGGHEGIEQAFNVLRLSQKPAAERTPLETAVMSSVYPERSGEVFMHPKRYWQRTGVATGHGSYHNYDTFEIGRAHV